MSRWASNWETATGIPQTTTVLSNWGLTKVPGWRNGDMINFIDAPHKPEPQVYREYPFIYNDGNGVTNEYDGRRARPFRLQANTSK